MSVSEEIDGAIVNLGNEARRSEGDPDYRVFWVQPDGFICWVNVKAIGPMEACQKVENALDHRGVIGANTYSHGEINIPDLR